MSLVVHSSRYLHYNAGAFVSESEACLIDPGITPAETAALHASVESAALAYVVLTHSDWDHVLGPEHLPATTIVAQAGFGRGLDPDEIRAELSGLESRAEIERDREFEPPRPNLTFESECRLRVGALELSLAHAPGHSANMLTIHEPVSGALWASDVLSDVEIPSVVDDLDRYERTLERVAAQDVRSLVPGHGTRTDDRAEIRRRLDEDRRYLADLRRTISDAVARGSSLAEAVAAAGTIALRRSDGDEEIHRLNSEKIYADLGGDADPSLVGYARARMEVTGR